MGAFLNRNECILVVVDIQERLHVAMEETFKETYVKNGIILIETARTLGMPLIVSEQYPRGLGKTIDVISGHIEGLPRMEKLAFSCMRDNAIRKAVEDSGRKTAVLIGIETHVCVMQTALDMMDAGYQSVIASDAVCSRRSHERITALDAMARLGVMVYPTETIAFMLMERAGTPEFKTLSPLFK